MQKCLLLLLAIVPKGISFVRPNLGSKHLVKSTTWSSSSSLTRRLYEQEFGWEAGDVHRDFALLEQAIAFSNAEQDLAHKERLEMLNHFAAHRKPVGETIQKSIQKPLFFSVVLTCLWKSSLGPITKLKSVLSTVSGVHFYTTLMGLPLIFLVGQKLKKHNEISVPLELKGIDPDYIQFLTTSDWENPKTSCRDYVLCLTEQWISTVVGMALCGPLLASSWRMPVQTLCRLAAFVSLYQYPKLLFQLNRSQQPRPITWRVWGMQRLVACQLMPWTFFLDLSCVMSKYPWPTIMLFYSGIMALLSGFQFSLNRTKSFPIFPRMRFSRRVLQFAFMIWLYQRLTDPMDALVQIVTTQSSRDLLKLRLLIPWSRVATFSVLCLCTVGPLVHLVAFKNLVKIVHTHNIPLSLEFEEFRNQLSDKSRKKWRVRLEWREPQRVRETISMAWGRLWYWAFFAGSIEDQLRKEFRTKRKSEATKRGLTVWQQVADEKRKDPDTEYPDRRTWKRGAMERLAAQHERDYKAGTYQDPLGVAVYKTLGVGLGFNFDHMSELSDGDTVTTRRLQARAAKSAIKRVQELQNPKSALEQLEGITSPSERNKKAELLRKQADDEIAYLARRLTELIPTDLSLDDRRTLRVQQYDSSRYTRVSSNEYSLQAPQDDSQALKFLMKSLPKRGPLDDIDYLNPGGDIPDKPISDGTSIDEEKLESNHGTTETRMGASVSNEADETASQIASDDDSDEDTGLRIELVA